MFNALKNMAVSAALEKVRTKVLNPKLSGIGVVDEMIYRDKRLFLKLRLEGLEDRPIDVRCSEINIAPDGSSLSIGKFESNMPFARVALESFAANRVFEIPEGGARVAIMAAKKVLGL